MGTRGSFPGGKAAGIVKLTTHLHLVPWSGMRRAIPPLLQYALMAWCSVEELVQIYLTLPLLQHAFFFSFLLLHIYIQIFSLVTCP